ncbi:MAG: hypothetical protein NT019_03350 [Candidatus Adlerbacteria bacterium]|nr:hypothetical protein [Candidatus Adlerbacteria bacterium]
MSFVLSFSFVSLLLYCVQQFGMALGVGAQTVLLLAYLHSMRDGAYDDQEKKFAKAVRHVMDFGFVSILLSGLGIVVLAYLAGQQEAFFSTIFLFKWSLISILLALSILNRGTSLVAGLLQGLTAGTWYALFVVHILAPEAPWLQLGEFYGAWLVGFTLCWTLVVFALRGKPTTFTSKPDTQTQRPSPSTAPLPNMVKPAVVINVDRQPVARIVQQVTKPVSVPTPIPVPVPTPVASTPKAALIPDVIIKPDPVAVVSNPAPVVAPVFAPVPPPPTPTPTSTPVSISIRTSAPSAAPAPAKPIVSFAPLATSPVTASAQPASPGATALFTGLHVMPRTAAELEKRNVGNV